MIKNKKHTPIQQGIKTVGIGKKGSRSLEPALIKSIIDEIKAVNPRFGNVAVQGREAGRFTKEDISFLTADILAAGKESKVDISGLKFDKATINKEMKSNAAFRNFLVIKPLPDSGRVFSSDLSQRYIGL